MDYIACRNRAESRWKWHKFHIGIDTETFQIQAIRLTANKVCDSQVLGNLLD
ncbi:hypothetical protein ACBO_11490 [Acinetobacter bouvetii]|nr:hypothetical protein ACBO_11490 [Acinetobacter bouvetii]